MGLLSSIFGGGGSKSSSATTSTSQTGEGGTSAGVASSGIDQVSLSNIAGGATLNIDKQGADADDFEKIVKAVSGATLSASTEAARAALEAGRPVADVARAATGSQSEAGKLAGQLAFPAAVLVALWMIFGRAKR